MNDDKTRERWLWSVPQPSDEQGETVAREVAEFSRGLAGLAENFAEAGRAFARLRDDLAASPRDRSRDQP